MRRMPMRAVDALMSAVDKKPRAMPWQKRGKNEESDYGNKDRYDTGLQ